MLSQRIKDLDIEPARYLNLGLASWVLVSAYLWRHTEPQFLATIAVGALIAIVAPFDVFSPRVRKINMAAGAFLALAAVALPHASGPAMWHNVVFGLLIVSLSFFGPPHGRVPPRPEAPADAYDGMGL